MPQKWKPVIPQIVQFYFSKYVRTYGYSDDSLYCVYFVSGIIPKLLTQPGKSPLVKKMKHFQ